MHYISHAGVSGYATAARRLVLALASAGVELAWTPIIFDAVAPLVADDLRCNPALEPLRHRPSRPDVVVVHAIPEVIPALEQLRRRGAALVAHTVWEAEELQDHWPGLLNRCDAVIVPTAWNARAFRAGG